MDIVAELDEAASTAFEIEEKKERLAGTIFVAVLVSALALFAVGYATRSDWLIGPSLMAGVVATWRTYERWQTSIPASIGAGAIVIGITADYHAGIGLSLAGIVVWSGSVAIAFSRGLFPSK